MEKLWISQPVSYTHLSQISRFELGETEISVFKLLYLLERIGVTLEEFLLICNHYQPSDFNTLIVSVKQAAYNEDAQALLDMVEKEIELFHETNSHYHKMCIRDRARTWPYFFLSKNRPIYGKIGSLLYEEISCQTSLKS